MVFICRQFIYHRKREFNPTSLEARLMFCSVLLIGSIASLGFATSYYEAIVSQSSDLSTAEMIFASFLHSLQTMVAGEGSEEYIKLGKNMVADIYSGKYENLYVSGYGIYSYLLCLFAPITSAAALFSILTAAFPKIKLKLSFFRKQYYFSELNEGSLVLAKSIVKNKTGFWNHPVLIFTDVYVDDENEKSSELYLFAKKIGAICVRDDIAHLKMKTFNEKEIFLLDEKESDNIKHLSELNDIGRAKKLRNALIYVFYQDDAYALIENKIKAEIAGQYKRFSKPPIVTRVKEYENLILKLLAEKPLVEPLVHNFKSGLPYPEKDNQEDYNLTIIGSGKIGIQMLLSSSWCGQFYGYKLNINVISNENKEDFERKINNLYPEFLESTKSGSHILKVFEGNDEKNEKYFNLRYGEYDFNKTHLTNLDCKSLVDDEEESFKIINSDYFLIALGNDEDNMLAAEKLKRQLSVLEYEGKEIKNRIIAFAVYNQKFNEILRKKLSNMDDKIKFFPFGSIEDTYSYQTITMANKDPAAILVKDTYSNQNYKEESREKKEETQEEQNKKIYDIMSSKAREIHLKYRIFSAFLLNKNSQTNIQWEKLDGFDYSAIETYEKMILSDDGREKSKDILHYLIWLEHRRWNGYMRSTGFSYKTMKSKNIELKLHGSLCESSKTPIKGHNGIRVDDLKNRLFDCVCQEKNFSKDSLENCVKKWMRLPKTEEPIQVELLLCELNGIFDDKIAVAHTEIIKIKKKYQDEINKIKKGGCSSEKEVRIKELSEKEKKEIKETGLDCVFNEIVDNCKKNDVPFKSYEDDMLDLASKRRGEDLKYFDDPQEQDTKLIEWYKENKEEAKKRVQT